MSDETAPEVEQESVATPTPPPIPPDPKPDKEIKRLQAALADRQKELADFKAQIEREKMTEAEKRDADYKAALASQAKLEAERDQAKAEADLQRKTLHLVSKHGLTNPAFGETVLKGFDPEAGTLDEYVSALKAQPEWAPVFRTAGAVSAQVPAPGTPASGNSRATEPAEALITDEDRMLARRQWPNNQRAQEMFLEGLKNTRKGRK